MTDVEPVATDFAASERAGRRNALPDIRGTASGNVTTLDLPHKLAELAMAKDAGAEGGAETTSKAPVEKKEEGK